VINKYQDRRSGYQVQELETCHPHAGQDCAFDLDYRKMVCLDQVLNHPGINSNLEAMLGPFLSGGFDVCDVYL